MRPRSIVSLLICVLILISFTRAQAAPATKPSKPATPTIAVFSLYGPLKESPTGEDLPFLGPPQQSLKELLTRMRKAGEDENVKAVVIMCEQTMFGFGQLEEIRNAIAELRAKGKDVYAHSDSMRFGGYLLLSSASRLSVVPTADVWLTGFFIESPHIRGLLDKIHVKPDVMTCGDYKTGLEFITRTEPSPQADEMLNWLLDSLYDTSIDHVAKARKISADEAKKLIDNGPYTAEQAKQAGLIDAVESRQDLDKFLKDKYGADIRYDRRYGKKDQRELDFSSPFAMFQILGEMFGGAHKKTSDKPAVGIVYVDGPIMPGRSEPSPFGSAEARSSEIRKALDEAARDENIKAVVLRVDSPGGSAVASEIILDATRRVKAKKPLVVSMGNIAGSGGYYVTCAADTIFADPTTITASIGVLSGKLVTTEMWQKIGVTFKPYKRGENAGMLSSYAPFSESERKRMQELMDEVYGTFKQHVVDNRKGKLKKPIDEIAGGRVYTGKQALELGLIDKLGGLNDAIAFAAEQAKLTDYDTRTVPEPKNFIERLMEQSTGREDDESYVALPSSGAAQLSLVDLARPHLAGLDEARVQAVIDMLHRLELLNQDRVLMVMPVSASPR